MNIYAKHGDKVIASNLDAGWNSDKEKANKHLKEGQAYTVHHTEVIGWSTKVYLLEKPNIAFNSVHFTSVPTAKLFKHMDNYGYACSCGKPVLLDKNTVKNHDSKHYHCNYCGYITTVDDEIVIEDMIEDILNEN